MSRSHRVRLRNSPAEMRTSRCRRCPTCRRASGNSGNFRQFRQQPQIEHGIGSGVIISPDGYIVTNNHVVDGAVDIHVTMSDRRVLPAKLVGADPLTDLAVIKIDGANLPSVPWGDSTQLHPGQTVLAFGNPLGFRFSVTRGIVSAVNRPNPFSDNAAQAGRIHPDRRCHQSGQLRRTAGERARRSGRHQHLPGLAFGRIRGHGLCHPDADRASDGGHADQVRQGRARVHGHRHQRRDAGEREVLPSRGKRHRRSDHTGRTRHAGRQGRPARSAT